MDTNSKKYVDMFRTVKIASAATIDANGNPKSRIINIMISTDDGMYIVTSKGKPFYKQLVRTGKIALSAMCPNNQSLQFSGKVKLVSKEWVDKVFEHNPGMKEVYPGDTRYILDAFLIYEGSGEWFDLQNHPIVRESFAYNAKVEQKGFEVTDSCIECGSCIDVCPQDCIKKGSPYKIEVSNCLHCGACNEVCPVGAIQDLDTQD